MERPQIQRKNVSTETRQNGRAVKGARVKKNLSWEFWYTSVCVGSNPSPVRKRFEHDEAEPSADKFCHTGTSIQDDCKAEENKKIAKSSVVDKRAVGNCTKKRYPAETCETRKYAWVWTQIFSNGLYKPCSRLSLWIEKITQRKGHKSKEKNVSTETRQNSRAV